MKSKLLLSPRFKWIGVFIFLPSFILGFANMFFEYEVPFLTVKMKSWMRIFDHDEFFNTAGNNLTDEIALTFTVIGLIMIAFSKEKFEDEFIQKIRLESFQWAVLVSYIILILCTWLIYGTSFFIAMVANLLTVLFIFNIRFHWLLMKNSPKKELA